MDLSRGYNLAPLFRERLRLLDWIADHGGDVPGRAVELGPLFEGLQPEGARALSYELRQLWMSGLFDLHEKLAFSSWSCTATVPGVRFIERVRERRGNALTRRRAARDAVLGWLGDCAARGHDHPSVAEFYASPYGSFLNEPFTRSEVAAACDWLNAEGYIGGEGSWGAGIPRPVLLTKGERVIERGHSVNDDEPPQPAGPTTNTYITGSHNIVAANSPGAVQTVTVTMTDDRRRQLSILADNLEGLLQSDLLGLNEATGAEAETVVADLRTTAERVDAPSNVLRQVLEKAKTVAIAGTGAAMGHGVVALADQALKALGLA